jgi:hypothetical protein
MKSLVLFTILALASTTLALTGTAGGNLPLYPLEAASINSCTITVEGTWVDGTVTLHTWDPASVTVSWNGTEIPGNDVLDATWVLRATPSTLTRSIPALPGAVVVLLLVVVLLVLLV